MNETQIPADPDTAFDLGRLLGQRRAFAAVAGRCSAAYAQLLRRIHDEKLYLPVAPSWEAFCGPRLAISRRHADRLIGLLNRFGPIYFELSLLVGITPREYLVIQPAVQDNALVVNGEAISLIPENAPKILEAVSQVLGKPPRTKRSAPTPETVRMRIISLGNRARELANQLVALYNSSTSARDRELILETATEIRLILMQPGID
jgi:hypothetical protein